jgi:hypothetical protein
MLCSEMSDAATALPETPLLERQLQMLSRLAEAGLEIALAIERKVKESEAAQPLAALTAAGQAYDRVARAVRLCILLQNELVKDRPDPQRARRERHRDLAVDVVRRVARDHCGEGPILVSTMAKEARDRLDTDDIYGEVLNRPVGELVALICRDLGIEPNWDALAWEAWAQEEMQSGVAGSPFVAAAPKRPLPRRGGGGPRRGEGGVPPPPRLNSPVPINSA